jgi:hypothetical protein
MRLCLLVHFDVDMAATTTADYSYAATLAAGAAASRLNGLSAWINLEKIRPYFNADHSYVIKKLGMILCAFFPGQTHTPYGDEVLSTPNRLSPNQPDLYIPLLSFMTYILTIGLSLGTDNKFEPDALGSVGMTGFLVLCFEVIAIRIGFMVLNIPSMSVLDCVAYSGYKYVGIALSTIVGIVFGRAVYYICLLYCAISMAKFIATVLYKHVQKVSTTGPASSIVNMCIFAVMVMQILAALYLGQAPRPEAVAPSLPVPSKNTDPK